MSDYQERINVIRSLPEQLEQLTAHLSSSQLTTAYNAPEWTVAQNIHHLADTHILAHIRFRLSLTVDNPDTYAVNVDEFAKLPDGNNPDVANSLLMLQGIHRRWTSLMDNMTAEEWQRTCNHPKRGILTLEDWLNIYVNHCKNHLQQIREVLEKM
jgi:hypothetical protein